MILKNIRTSMGTSPGKIHQVFGNISKCALCILMHSFSSTVTAIKLFNRLNFNNSPKNHLLLQLFTHQYFIKLNLFFGNDADKEVVNNKPQLPQLPS